MTKKIDYKFNEANLINELQAYIDKTYNQHYAGGKIQATEDIIDDGHGTGFCIGNSKKYLKRYGKKGETPMEWRKDLMKVLHYSLIQLYVHDRQYAEEPISPQMDLGLKTGMDAEFQQMNEVVLRLNDATPEEWNHASAHACKDGC